MRMTARKKEREMMKEMNEMSTPISPMSPRSPAISSAHALGQCMGVLQHGGMHQQLMLTR